VNGRRFGFSAGIGLDAELVRAWTRLAAATTASARGPRPRRRERGALVGGGSFEPALEVRAAGRAAFALVANGDPYTYAGSIPIRVAPQARFELGLDLVAPKHVRAGHAAAAAALRPAAAARRARASCSTRTTSTG
jgi:hypothetical protein